MSFYLYDEAIVNNLRSLVNDDRIHIVPPDNALNVIGRITDDDIKLPLISLSRTSTQISNSISHPMKFDGGIAGYDSKTKIFKKIQAIPIRINYLLDVWTKHRQENDDIIRELIFYISTHPTMKVEIPYGLDIEHKFNIFIDSDIDDNSDIVEHKNRGEYFRQTLSLYTDDAYLWKSASRYFMNVDVGLKIENE